MKKRLLKKEWEKNIQNHHLPEQNGREKVFNVNGTRKIIAKYEIRDRNTGQFTHFVNLNSKRS